MVCSFSAATPFIILLISIISSLKIYLKWKKYNLPAAAVHCSKEQNKYGIEIVEPSYKRIQYFKKYLRPPKEQILQQFRKYAVKEKIICTMYSEIWKYMSMLILLIVLSLPDDTQTRYLQGASIQKLLLKPKDISAWKSRDMLYKWLKSDFSNHVYGDPDCFNQHMECGIVSLTGCTIVGSIILRNFKTSTVCALHSQIFSQCEIMQNTSDANETLKSISHYERRFLNGYYSTYYWEDKLLTLKDNKLEAMAQLDSVLQWLNNSFDAISLEFLLFNPSSSTFISISIIFEISPTVPFVIKQNVVFAKIYGNYDHLIKFILYLIFSLVTIVSFKNKLWSMFKHGSFYWKQCWNYFLLTFTTVSVIFLISYGVYIIHLISTLNKLTETNISSNLNLTDLASLEMINRDLLAFLIFFHLIGSLRIFSFSYRLRRILKRLINAWKQMSLIFFTFLLLISLCSLIDRNFVGETHKHANPLLSIIKGINSIYNSCKKPEIVNTDENMNRLFSMLNLFCVAAIHIGLLAIVRSILITLKCSSPIQKEKISLWASCKVIKQKLLACFDPGVPQVISKDDYVLPIEFLLLELERLSEVLLIKADYLFAERDEINENCTSDKMYYENIEYFKPEEVLKLKNFCYAKPLDIDDCALQSLTSNKTSCYLNLMNERLTATIPRQSKPKEKKFTPISLNASLASQRKFKKHQSVESETLMQSHKIRKTYPLFQLESDSSSTEAQASSEKDLTNGLPIRKTKSMGKGKNQDFHLNVLKDS